MRIALTEKRDMLGDMVAVCRTGFGGFWSCVQWILQLLYSMKLGNILGRSIPLRKVVLIRLRLGGTL